MQPQKEKYEPRIYPLDPRELTEEQIAVIFAMTSRRPEPFDQIREMVTTEKASDFHERWVLNYGHASVAEHAIIHMAVENISRLSCDSLEDNRLAAYTEKSSRYQIIPPGYYHVPAELNDHSLLKFYIEICDRLFALYQELLENTRAYLRTVRHQREGERDSAHDLRLRREAIDSCRFILPAATLTNVGVSINARSLENAIRKLLSSDLIEENILGEQLKEQGRKVTPTLIKYAERNRYLVDTLQAQRAEAIPLTHPVASKADATLVHYDPNAELKVASAFLYRYAHQPYEQIWERVNSMSSSERRAIIHQALSRLDSHDQPIRETELPYYTFDIVLDYGAFREFKRHRMQTYIPQPLTIELGYVVPPLLEDAGLHGLFDQAMSVAEDGYASLERDLPLVASYLVTHAHRRRVLSTMNLRECYHLFKLRTQSTAHFSLVSVMQKALDEAKKVHPVLFEYLQLRG
jgi:thymidylate synthase ThyX